MLTNASLMVIEDVIKQTLAKGHGSIYMYAEILWSLKQSNHKLDKALVDQVFDKVMNQMPDTEKNDNLKYFNYLLIIFDREQIFKMLEAK